MKPLIVANWKCNPMTQAEAKRLFNLVRRRVKNIKNAEVVICSPFVYLSSFKFQASSFKLGAQNCFWEKGGAYTGEVSAKQLSNLGCKYVIIGHSERRRYFAETDEIINRKLKLALSAKLNPILCIGETKKEREQGKTERVFKKQLEGGLEKVSNSRFQVSRTCIAYEPAWAIGTGNPCDAEEAQKMGLLIRKIITKLYNKAASKKVRILYGGSVNSKNAASYVKEVGLQGLLVGGASLNAKEFIKIVKEVS